MQAVAEAIASGSDCLSSEAIADIFVEASVDVTTNSTCGLTATAFQFDPNEDGPVLAPEKAHEVVAVAQAPLKNPEEEQQAGELIQALIERTPVVDTAPTPAPAEEVPVVPTVPVVAPVPPPPVPAAPSQPQVVPVGPTGADDEGGGKQGRKGRKHRKNKGSKGKKNKRLHSNKTPEVKFQEEKMVAGPWEQCGGKGWIGPTACSSGYTCVADTSGWYSQCRCAFHAVQNALL
jgi:hypothetical protein